MLCLCSFMSCGVDAFVVVAGFISFSGFSVSRFIYYILPINLLNVAEHSFQFNRGDEK